jgi:hypothetical protein
MSWISHPAPAPVSRRRRGEKAAIAWWYCFAQIASTRPNFQQNDPSGKFTDVMIAAVPFKKT